MMSVFHEATGRESQAVRLPGTGDILIPPDGILAKKCGDKCRGLANCSLRGCPDVVHCERHTCTADKKPGGCYPKFVCDRHTCTGVTIQPSVEAAGRGAEVVRARQQIAAYLTERRDAAPDSAGN